MTDYIKREAAIEAIKDFAKHAIDEGRRSLDAVDDSIRLCDEIANIPVADIDRPTASQFKRMAAQKGYAPVVHGQWECVYDDSTGETDITCSHCKNTRTVNGCFVSTDGKSCYFEDDYCPYCGAKMDGGANNG